MATVTGASDKQDRKPIDKVEGPDRLAPPEPEKQDDGIVYGLTRTSTLFLLGFLLLAPFNAHARLNGDAGRDQATQCSDRVLPRSLSFCGCSWTMIYRYGFWCL